MTLEDVQQMADPAMREWIRANKAADPHRLALQRQSLPFSQTLAVAQVSLLQRAAAKLPTWSQTGCLLSSRALEQCTSEALAAAKPFGTGSRALDLTCGLGVDSFLLSRRYGQVTSLEPDAALAAMVRFNADLLDVRNVVVLEKLAEEFLSAYDGPGFDLIYVDPDRRTAGGKRVHALSDCAPDVVHWLPRMRILAPRVLVKASPMLDLVALERLFPGEVFLWVLSEGNECKEVLLEFGRGPGRGAIFLRKGRVGLYEHPGQNELRQIMSTGIDFAYVLEPDIALYKADLVPGWLVSAGIGGSLRTAQGFVYAAEDVGDFHGHRYRVMETWPYKPQTVRTALKALGIQRVQYVRRDFDLPMAEVMKAVGIPEGGGRYLLLTRWEDGSRMAILAERLG